MFMVLSLPLREFTRFILMNVGQRRAASDPPTKPTDLGVESACMIYIHHRHLLLLSPKADTHFTVPRRVEG